MHNVKYTQKFLQPLEMITPFSILLSFSSFEVCLRKNKICRQGVNTSDLGHHCYVRRDTCQRNVRKSRFSFNEENNNEGIVWYFFLFVLNFNRFLAISREHLFDKNLETKEKLILHLHFDQKYFGFYFL